MVGPKGKDQLWVGLKLNFQPEVGNLLGLRANSNQGLRRDTKGLLGIRVKLGTFEEGEAEGNLALVFELPEKYLTGLLRIIGWAPLRRVSVFDWNYPLVSNGRNFWVQRCEAARFFKRMGKMGGFFPGLGLGLHTGKGVIGPKSKILVLGKRATLGFNFFFP